jgi:hypothetical protein
MPIENLKSGWLYLEASGPDPNILDVLQLSFTGSRMPQGIHVPSRIDERNGELTATHITGDERGTVEVIGRGIILPFRGGIKIVSPDDWKRSRLKVGIIQSLRKTWINLRFETT